MSVSAKKFWNIEDVHYFAEDIVNRYYLNIGQNQISEVVESFIYKLSENCAGIFDEDSVWSIIKILELNNCMNEEVLKDSSIQKFIRTSNPLLNNQIKDEVMDLATNKIVKHVNKRDSEVREYRTKCFTVDSLKDSVQFGELISTLEYSQDGFDLKQIIDKNEEGVLDFSQNNLLIKIKEDICNNKKKQYVRIILVNAMEKSK